MRKPQAYSYDLFFKNNTMTLWNRPDFSLSEAAVSKEWISHLTLKILDPGGNAVLLRESKTYSAFLEL